MLVFPSGNSPTGLQYDCPCQVIEEGSAAGGGSVAGQMTSCTGCVVDLRVQGMALIKGTWAWELVSRDGAGQVRRMEGTRPGVGF